MTKALAPIAPTWSDIVDAHSQVLRNPKWRALSLGEINLSVAEKTKLIEAVLRDRFVNTTNLKFLYNAMREKDQNGWSLASGFPELFTIVEEFLQEKGFNPEPEPPKEDIFKRGLIDAEQAIARVASCYPAIPKGATDSKLLQIALGDVLRSDESVTQLWLTFSYYWKEVLGGKENGSDVMPQAARWIVACCCGYANPKGLGLPSPVNFTFADDIAFRS